MPNTNNQVTIKSIAKALGISFSTVSKALNGSPVVKPETREMVIEKAKEMGYTPNALAKTLRGKSSKTIAIIFSDIENPVLTYIFRSVAKEMAGYDFTTMIFDSQYDEKTERANIITALSHRPDFIILEPVSNSLSNLDLLEGMEHRLILQGAEYASVKCHHVHIDYYHGGYLAAQEMLSKGHRDILVLTEPLVFPISGEFVEGIFAAFREYGLSLPEDHVLTAHSSIANGFMLMQDLWDDKKKAYRMDPTGIITFDDNIAFGVYRSAMQNGLSIPDDLSIIGFDDNPLSAFSNPALTTVHLPKEKMAENCISILKTVLIENSDDICFFSSEPMLILRNSIRAIS